MGKKIILLVMLACLMASMTGCYFKKEVGTNEVGVEMSDGTSITSVVGPGRYTNMSWYAGMRVYDGSSKTIQWVDNDVWTSDKQVISFASSVTYARKTDEASVRQMWKDYNAAAVSDQALEVLVRTKIPEAVKQISTTLKLDQMLGIADDGHNRTTLKNAIVAILKASLDQCGVTLIDFTVDNVGVDEAYKSKMQEKATAGLEADLAEQKKHQLEIQLDQEKAQTDIDLEKARRQNLVAEEQAKVYQESPEAYELARLRAMKDLLGASDKVYFIPDGSDITLFFGGNTGSSGVPMVP